MVPYNKALQPDKFKLSCLLRSQKPRQRAFAAELGRWPSGEKVTYDDAPWHYDTDNFPKGLGEVAGTIHTGMFVAWELLSRLSGSIHIKDFCAPNDAFSQAKKPVARRGLKRNLQYTNCLL